MTDQSTKDQDAIERRRAYRREYMRGWYARNREKWHEYRRQRRIAERAAKRQQRIAERRAKFAKADARYGITETAIKNSDLIPTATT